MWAGLRESEWELLRVRVAGVCVFLVKAAMSLCSERAFAVYASLDCK